MRLFGMADSDFFVPACSCARLFMLPLKKYVHYFAVQIHTARAEFCRGSHGHLGQLLGKLNLAVIILEVKKIELDHRILQVKNISLSPEPPYIGDRKSTRLNSSH